ncbi:MAG: ABC transporter ATP-binding protein [Xanthobacteraceae bacterium]|nr:ABC transporter ATP-binding protein [Xanthobacteraceae bacterium]MBV9632606.1 ABC transporter ATP-binding protein [Xanthobacteraceae bacterium]
MELNGVNKSFALNGERIDALRSIDLFARPGEFVCVVGASGCGKSTLLRLILGLDHADAGRVSIDGKPVTAPGPDRGIVFQDHRLFPWLTVSENIALALHASDWDASERRRRVREHIDLVGLGRFGDALPDQISGGMAQRAAIARALVAGPKVLLLDEPLGALDALTRHYLQDELLRVWQAERPTVIMVTHDIDEAVYLGDRVIVMSSRPGRIKKSIDIDLERPRRRDDLRLAALRNEILSLFDWSAIAQQ